MSGDRVDSVLDQWARERPELDPSSLGVVLRVQRLERSIRQAARRAVAGAGLQLWEYEVLAALRRQGRIGRLSASDLARAAMLSPAAMTHRIDRLETRGLVRRETSDADRRSVLVRLTPAGRRKVDEALTLRFQSAARITDGLSAEERRSLDRLLRKLTPAA